jgi:hypothetical protein
MLLAPALGACSTEPACSADELTAQLADAEEGDVVEVGACSVTGSFTVPAGVTLRGQGRTASTLVAPPDGFAVALTPGTEPSRLEQLAVESAAAAAVVAHGAGSVRVEAVDVRASRGIGIGADGVTTVEIVDVTVAGPVSSAAQALTPGDAAREGIVLENVPTASLAGVTVSGFALRGVLARDSGIAWSLGGAVDNAGVGLFVSSSSPVSATLTGIELSRTLPGSETDQNGVLLPPYGGVFVGAKVASNALVVTDNAGTGLLHVGADASHTGLTASGNGTDDTVTGGAGVWVQEGAASVDLEGATLENNAFAGLVALDVSGTVSISTSTVAATRRVTRTLGETGGPVELGDGIALVRSTEVALTDVEIDDNERIGLLLDLGPTDVSDALLDFANVNIAAGSGDHGAVCQGQPPAEPAKEVWGPDLPLADEGWDDGILRDPATLTKDKTLNADAMGNSAMPVDVVGVVGPCGMPVAEQVVIP